jgi:hypothetical protein
LSYLAVIKLQLSVGNICVTIVFTTYAKTATFAVTALLSLGLQAQPQQAADPSTDIAAELRRVTNLLIEQQKTLDSLQATVADQQRKLDRLEAANRPPEPVTIASIGPVSLPSRMPAVAAPQQQVVAAQPAKPAPAPARRWYEKYAFRGYTQIRHNRLYDSNPGLLCEQCDRTIGPFNNVSFRRARFILSGDVTDRIYIYFQPDFDSTSGNLHFGQVRDLYFDVALDSKKEFRIRAGQSKVPYGFENLQSSQNRLALDRNDALNSAVANERDIGAFFYWAPAGMRTRLAELVSSGLKGTGDYGIVGAGVYNGQTANRPEANNNLHYVARVMYPWQLKNGQFIEAGIQAYTGRYTVTGDQRSTATKGPADFTFADRRIAGSFVYYPQPFGFQAEFNVGRGPQYNTLTRTIEARNLRGGYAQTMYMKKFKGQALTPFYRFQYYSGGKKQELDARRYLLRDHEFGMEWQPNASLELLGQYSYGDRTFEDGKLPNNRQKGSLVRLQLQINY